MAEGIAFDLVKKVIDKLGPALWDEIELLRSFKDDVKDLKSNFSAIQAVLLDAEEKSSVEEESHSLRDWLGKLKDAAYDIDDLLDEIRTQALLRKQPHEEQNQNQLAKMVCDQLVKMVCDQFHSWMFKFEMAHRMKELRQKIDKIAKQRNDFGLVEAGTRRQTEMIVRSDDRETDSSVEKEKMVGRDDDIEEIVKLLLETNSDHDLSVIPIVGMGGLGKTTLAQLAFNDRRVTAQQVFDLQVWVYVSTDFDMKKIAEAVKSTTRGEGDLRTKESSKNFLRDTFSQKRFLLVLDDVWNEDQGKWEELENKFKVGKKGSKILVTTRSEKVAEIMKTTEQPHHLKGLSDDDCWKLFKRRAFGEGEENDYPKLVEIGRQIVGKCGHLPLAALALGRMMRSEEKTEATWSAMRDSEIWRLEKKKETREEDKILPSLKLSYIHMRSSALKECFAYCSIFPKGYEIDKDDLIQQWIALGFISSPNTSSTLMEDIGNKYFKELLRRYFLQEVEDSKKFSGRVTYRMHDLMHDLAQSVARDEVAVRVGEESTEIPEGCRYASIHSRSIQQVPTTVKQRLRALQFGESASLTTFYSEAKCLRLLDLHDSGISMLPTSIGKLKLLTYLNLSSTNIQELPESITGLCNLQTLNLSSCKKISTLPNSLESLSNLRSLDLSHSYNLTLLDSISNLQNLYKLNLCSCRGLRSLEPICHLKNLHDLNLSYLGHSLELPDSIGSLENLCFLDLSCSFSLLSLPESIKNLENLRILNLSQCIRLLSLPSSLCQLKNLHDLNLSLLSNLRALPESIGNLENLRILNLSDCNSLLSLPSSLSDLQHLEKLDIRHCRQLRELPKMIGNLTKLRELLNEGCSKLKGMPRGIGKLVSLPELPIFVIGKQDGVEQCASISELKQLGNVGGNLEIKGLENVTNPVDAKAANLIEKKNLWSLKLKWNVLSAAEEDMDTVQPPAEEMDAVLENLQPHQNLKKLVIEGYAGGKFPSWLMNRIGSCLPNLVKIKLVNIPRCSSLPPLGLLPVLEKLIIRDMPAITNLDVKFDGDSHINESANKFPAPRRLDLSDMPTKLKYLYIHRCSSLRYLPVQKMTTLRWLTIEDCPLLFNAGGDVRVNERPEPFLPSSVEKLEIFRMSKEFPSLILKRPTMDSETPADNGDAVSLRQPNMVLQELRIENCQQLTCLPEGLRSFTSLQELTIWDCENLQRIEVWLGELTKLKKLKIGGCSSLRYLSVHKMTTLTELYITDCPLLFNAGRDVRVNERPEPCLPSSVQELEIYGVSKECLSVILKRPTMDSETPADDGDVVSLQQPNMALRRLQIGRCQQLTCLPEGLRSLTTLERLIINNCNDLQRIEDWLGELTKLKYLSIRVCESLRYLPAHKMTSLKSLQIIHCPLLVNADGQVVDTINVDQIGYVEVDFRLLHHKKQVSNS